MAKYRKSQGWAERKVNTACNKFINTYPIKPWTHYAAQTLLAEHREGGASGQAGDRGSQKRSAHIPQRGKVSHSRLIGDCFKGAATRERVMFVSRKKLMAIETNMHGEWSATPIARPTGGNDAVDR